MPKKKTIEERRLNYDKDKIYALAKIHCTMDEICAVMRMDMDDLRELFIDEINLARKEGKASVRRMLFHQAEQEGNATAIRYLVHNVLRERIDLGIDIKIFKNQLSNLSDEELFKLAQEKLKEKDSDDIKLVEPSKAKDGDNED